MLRSVLILDYVIKYYRAILIFILLISFVKATEVSICDYDDDGDYVCETLTPDKKVENVNEYYQFLGSYEDDFIRTVEPEAEVEELHF